MKTDIELMKREFASHLKKCLEANYGGRIPSFSKIARDFSLRAPHLPHVSGETVRKWLRAESIPQYPRMQSLADWLGSDLFVPFENWQSNTAHQSNGNANSVSSEELMRLFTVLQKLHREDFNLVIRLAEKLSLATESYKNVSQIQESPHLWGK